MSSLAGTKRAAETPVASPTKAAAYTKRFRTHYDYFDEEDPEDMQWSGDDWSDDSSIMDLDDTDEFEGGQERLSPDDLGDDYLDALDDKASRSRSKEAERDDAIPARFPVSTRRRCELSVCRNPSLCGDPMSHLDTEAVFGPGEVTLHPCAIHHLAHSEAIVPAWLTTRDLFELAYEQTYPVPYQDTGVIAAWHAKWTALGEQEKEEQPGVTLQQELLRLAFSCTSGSNMFYSFCFQKEHLLKDDDFDGPWRAIAGTGHCRTCGKCATQYNCHSPGNHEF